MEFLINHTHIYIYNIFYINIYIYIYIYIYCIYIYIYNVCIADQHQDPTRSIKESGLSKSLKYF